jgi:hypothetical protein
MPTKPETPDADQQPTGEPLDVSNPTPAETVKPKPVKLPPKAAKKPGTAMIDVSQEMARRAAMIQATEKSDGVPYISTKAGEFKFQDTALENPMRVVLLDYSLMNMFYGGGYDEDNPQPPVCAAVTAQGEGAEDGMTALSESPGTADQPGPQASKCAECPHNVFGSDDRGKGKACKNQRRLALVSCRDGSELDALAETSDVAFLRVPPGSLSNFRKYVKQLSKVKGLPPLGVITDIGIQKRGGGHELTFEFVADVPKEKLATVLKLADSVQEMLLEAPSFEARAARAKPKPAKKATVKGPARQAKFV